MMFSSYLLDENVAPYYQSELIKLEPAIVVWKVGDPGAPSRGTLDPAILLWCEKHNFILVTNNRSSMPIHLKDHLERGKHIPGLFILNPKLEVDETIEELAMI